jgi:hypothetical protein
MWEVKGLFSRAQFLARLAEVLDSGGVSQASGYLEQACEKDKKAPVRQLETEYPTFRHVRTLACIRLLAYAFLHMLSLPGAHACLHTLACIRFLAYAFFARCTRLLAYAFFARCTRLLAHVSVMSHVR